MSHQEPQTFNSGAKTLRLTENKRRYRARRKEYIADLETKLAEAREQGVQATKEVQLAARQVALENGRLRDLLRLAGFSHGDIDSWRDAGCRGNGGDGDTSNSSDQHFQTEQKARRCAAALAAYQGADEREWMMPLCEIACGSEKGLVKTIEAEKAEKAEKSSCTRHEQIIPSCKLITRLTENPAADITQVPAAAPLSSNEEPHQDAGASHGGGGIECRKAYDMLIQYATTEDKMDTIARALESGCTKNGKGGCAVKSKVVLQALDDVCE
ncbi:hypothetical protein B0T25DRAFT_517953 [Lasiosphaeria hispida]|uniref:BZIP domain-containing protein n=1 Tax=Lasiosphaeria hispida TaxID=260671 RepID=A0AAJ0ME29_9PEZI|nr:hypothetical protein B0T25DRAFT_517953 [Lasiosphaeria hispida]